MARKRFGIYVDFLVSVERFWTQLGDNFSVGEWNKAHVEAEAASLKALNEEIWGLENDLNSARNRRDLKCKEIESFNSRLRGAVMGEFGTLGDQFKLLPRLLKHGVGRPNKAAATRKANTIKRKLAAQELEKSE